MAEQPVKNLFIRKNAKTYAAAAIIYLVISMVVFWPLLTGIATKVVNGGGDVYQSMWNLWWMGYSIFGLHTNPYFSQLLYYPVGANLVTQTLAPLTGIASLPFQAVSLPFAYNVMFFMSFMLSGLFMYMLAYYLTGNKYAAFVAGLVFAFSPLHVAQAYGHLDWTVIEFMPLFTLFFLLMIKDKKMKYSLGAAVSFVLLTFAGDIEQGIMAIVLAFFILLYYLATKERKQVLSRSFAISFGAMIGMVLVIGAVFFIPIAEGAIGGGALSTAGQLSGVSYNEMWSQNVLSFFLPSSFNSIFQGAAKSYSFIFTPDPTERTSYIGYAVLALCIAGLYHEYTQHRLQRTAIWVVLAVVFAWLSLGPYVQIGGGSSGSFVSGIPGLYLLYSYIPLFNIIREPGRFDVIVTIALAVLSAYGVSAVVKHDPLSSKASKRRAYAAIAAISLIILLEGSGIALPGQFASSMYLSAKIPKAYTELGMINSNFTVMVLPDITNTTRPDLYTGMGMYFQTAFRHQMIGGYTSRVTNNESLSISLIPLSQSSAYLEQGYGFIYPNPITENVTSVDYLLLASYNVGFVSIIRDAYNTTDLAQLYNYLYSMFGQPAYISNSTIVFSTNNGLVSNVGKQPVEYVTGTWIPGYALCHSYYGCNSTVQSLWWGPSLRSIQVFAPQNQTSLYMTFNAASVTGQQQLELIVNTPSNIQKVINLSSNMTPYSANLTFNPGYNTLYLFNPSKAAAQSLDSFGISNITFSTR